MLPSSRTYHDPLHGAITLDMRDRDEALITQLIDTPVFQRLRRIRQLGTASLTFHGAEGSRFTHSLGVMHVARRAFDRLSHRYPDLVPYRATVLCAALLHDIGHGPWSHTCEDIFQTHHEDWTCRLLHDNEVLHKTLHTFDPDLTAGIIAIYQKRHPVPLVQQLISSQLDCDRLDYLMRDSYFTGAAYGQLDLDRILLALDYDPATQQLIVTRKGLAATEHYLVVRYFMYAQVYNHPKNIAAGWGLEQLFRRARELYALGQLQADGVLSDWLSLPPDQLSVESFLAADDGVMTYHIQNWCHHNDPILRDHCRRYRDRDLLKARDVSHLPASTRDQLLKQAKQAISLSAIVADPASYYVGIQTATMRGYTLYQRGLMVRTQDHLQELSDLSPLVQTLTQPDHRAWLIYPREIESVLPTV